VLPAVPDADVRRPARAISAPVFKSGIGVDRLGCAVCDRFLVHALKRVNHKKADLRANASQLRLL
jgi:hypothetical protein